MPQKFANNLQAVLSADITSTTISIPVVSTTGFPALGAGDWFYLTLTDKREGGEKRWEIVKVTAYQNNVLTVNRGQDGTAGQSWLVGSELNLRVTASDMQSLKDGTTQAGDTVTLTGDVTGTATVSASGSISVATTIAANSVALGTDTTGNYVAYLVAGNGISVSAAGEGATPTVTNTAPNVTTNITTTHNATNVVVNSSDGTGGTINAATTTLAGVMSSADKTKLDGIATGAEVNQNAFSNVLVGTTTLSAELKTDTLNLVAGTNITLTADSATDTVTISADDVSVDWTQVQNKPDPVITLAGDLSGSVTLTDLGSGTLTATIQPNSVALGTDTTGNYVAGVTQGTDVLVTGTAGEGWSPTISVDSASANTASKIVKRDASGNFSAGTITATLSGNATTATTLQTARTINGVSFNGSANITIADSTKIPTTEKGVANGVATLGADGKVPSTQLPSYVDDVQEYTNLAGFPTTGEAGKIYVAINTNKTYRWSGSTYVYITSGAVDSVAGKTGVVTLVKGDVGLGNVDNTSDAAKPVSTATQTALNLKANLASPALTGTPTAPTAAVGTNTTQVATTAFVEAATAPATLLADIKTVDGSGSGLDADLLDGLDSTKFLRSDVASTTNGDLTITARLGVGSAGVDSAAIVRANDTTSANANSYGVWSSLSVDSTTLTADRSHYGGFFSATYTGKNDVSFAPVLYGSRNEARTTAGSGSSTQEGVLYANYNYALHDSDDPVYNRIKDAFGSYNYVYLSGNTANVTNAYGTFNNIRAGTTGSSIDNAYLFYGTYGTVTGTITNRWGIYIASSTAYNYLSGGTQIGGTTPTSTSNYGLGVGTVPTGAGNIDATGTISAPTINTGALNAVSVQANNLISGTYTPTQASTNTNVASVTFHSSYFMRVGNVVTVSLTIGITPVATSTGTIVNFSLPFPSNLTSTAQLNGTGYDTASGVSGGLVAGTVSKCASFYVIPNSVNNRLYRCHFTYVLA
jgi:hypothetical protein